MELVDKTEEKYFIAEVLDKPKELANKGYYYALQEACKAMNDRIGDIEEEQKEYQEYVESFAHEIKTPIAALFLSLENQKNKDLKEEVSKIHNLIEQMLYYARSENTEKDYFVKALNLQEVFHPIFLSYKDYILKKEIQLLVHDIDVEVYTDEKWLTFILSQILQNAIKYVDKKNKKIEIYSTNKNHSVSLIVLDNGCGISKADIQRVFEKGFTGSHRHREDATGMGLYLAKKLCDSLHLHLSVESKEGEYTKVCLVFPKGTFYEKDTL